MSKKKKSGMKSKEYWDVSNWLWEGLDSDDELLIAYNRRPSEDMTSMCALCYQWFKSSDDFHSHMVTHIDTSRFHECSVCKKRFVARFLRMRHESIHRYESNHPFTAYWGGKNCDFPFDFFVKNHPMKRFKPVPYSPQYIRHLKNVEKLSEVEPISCIVCSQIFQTYDDLTNHYDRHHAIHQCVQCNALLENFSEYQVHLKDKHGIDLPVNCSGGRWQILEELTQPEDPELEQIRATVKFFHNYADPILPSTVRTYARLRSERAEKVSLVPPGETPTDPPEKQTELDSALPEVKDSNAQPAERIMEAPFSDLLSDEGEGVSHYRLEEQINSDFKYEIDTEMPVLVPVTDDIEWVDPEDETFPCQVCGRNFPDERMRNRHRRLHNVPGEKPFECKYCKKAFATHSNRKEHERIHTGERPYKCPVCDRRFIQISNLKKHIQTHKDLNTLKCTTCGKQFVKESSLVLHQRSHATERKFRCDICDRAYNYASLLKRHMRIHTGECPYQCPDCQMPFHELVSLHYHRKKMHTGERPHKCGVCGRGFILSSDLKKHHRVHMKGPEKERLMVGSNMTPESLDNRLKENGKLGITSGSDDDDDDDADDGTEFLNNYPEVSLVVRSPKVANKKMNSEADSFHEDAGKDLAQTEEVELSNDETLADQDLPEVQVSVSKETVGEEDRRVLTNGNSILKTPNSMHRVNAKLLENHENDEGPETNDENNEKTSGAHPGASHLASRPATKYTKIDNAFSTETHQVWVDEEPALVD